MVLRWRIDVPSLKGLGLLSPFPSRAGLQAVTSLRDWLSPTLTIPHRAVPGMLVKPRGQVVLLPVRRAAPGGGWFPGLPQRPLRRWGPFVGAELPPIAGGPGLA